MIQFLNDKLRFVLVILLVIIGISFVFFGSWTPDRNQMFQDLGVVDGKNVRPENMASSEREVILANYLSDSPVPPQMMGGSQAIWAQAWINLLLDSAVKHSGITVSPKDVEEFLRSRPIFKDKDQFSPTQYKNFTENLLKSIGVNLSQFDSITENVLKRRKFIESLINNIEVKPEEVKDAVNSLYGTVDTQVIYVNNKDFEKSVQINDEVLKKFFEERISKYQKPEQRRVEFVEFGLTDAQLNLEPKARAKAKYDLGQKVFAFTEKFLNPETGINSTDEFRKIAKAQNLVIKKSELLTSSSKFYGNVNDSRIMQEISKLTPQAPVGDLIETDFGYIVVALSEVVVPKKPELKDVRAQVVAEYTTLQSKYLAREKGIDLANQLNQAIKQGKSWNEAVASLKLTTKTLPSFVPTDGKNLDQVEAASLIKFNAHKLKQGEVSRFLETDKGGIIIYLAKRINPSDTKVKESEKDVKEILTYNKKQQAYEEWLMAQINSPRNQLPKELRAQLGL